MNYNYLQKSTLGTHAVTLIVVFVQLLGKDEISQLQEMSVTLIGIALPWMVMAFVFSPEPVNLTASRKIYMLFHPVAHLIGISALTCTFAGVSHKAGLAFGVASTFCLLTLVIYQYKVHNSPAAKEAFARVNKNA